MPGKRIHELLLLETIVNSDAIKWSDFVNKLETMYNLENSKSLHDSVFNVLSGDFYTGFAVKLYKDHPFIIENNGVIEKSPIFAKAIDKEEFANVIEKHIEYGIHNYKKSMENYSKKDRSSYMLNIPMKMCAAY